MAPKRKSGAALSDSEEDYDPAPSSPKKRATTKKSAASSSQNETQALVNQILADPEAFPVPDTEEATREAFVKLATYIHASAQATSSAASAPRQMSEAEVLAAVALLRETIAKQISKLMVWKSTCKEKRAKFSYAGVCTESVIFHELMGVQGQKATIREKVSPDDLTDRILQNRVEGKARYDNLYPFGDVTITWSAKTGAFKFTGSYGVSRQLAEVKAQDKRQVSSKSQDFVLALAR